MTDNKRSKPFTQFEKDELLIVLKQYSKIIENKKSDATSLKGKNDAWINVWKEYNSNGEVTPRSLTQLKRAWEVIKSVTKKVTTVDVTYTSGTSGGKCNPTPAPNPLVEQIAPHLTHFVQQTQDSDAVWMSAHSSRQPLHPDNGQGPSSAAAETPLFLAVDFLEENMDSGEDNSPSETHSDHPAAEPTTSTPCRKRSRVAILSEEHGERMQQLAADVRRQTDLHKLRILEAKAALEAANFRAKKDEEELLNAREERAFQNERRRLELAHMRSKMAIELKRLELE